MQTPFQPTPPLSLQLIKSPTHFPICNTVKYLPFCICLWMQLDFTPPSVYAFMSFGCEPFCTKTGRHAQKGLTSAIHPSPAFSNLLLFLPPFYLLSGCTYVRPSFGKAQPVWKHSLQKLTKLETIKSLDAEKEA